MDELVRSISYDQSEIIRSILKLHVPDGRIDCDPTYSTGNFYKGTGIGLPRLKFDINPQAEGVVRADARHLPIGDASIACMMFDPPFLATKGSHWRREEETASTAGSVCFLTRYRSTGFMRMHSGKHTGS